MSYIGHTPAHYDGTASSAGTTQPTPAQLQAKQHNESDDDTATVVPSHTPTEDVGQLARYLSTQSTSTGGNLFEYEKDSVLDPFGDKFDSKLWVRKFASLEDWGQDRASGVSFKNLSVFGYGTDAGGFHFVPFHSLRRTERMLIER